MKNLFKIVAASAFLLATPALAGEPVSLRSNPTASGPVTLGDLFDGAGSAGSVVVAPPVGGSGNLVLDAGALQRIALQHGLTWANETAMRRVIVRPAGAAPAAASAAPAPAQAARPARGVEALVWARNINAGEIVRADDLEWGTVASLPSGAANDAGPMIGKAARRALRQGAAVQGRDVTAPQVIRKDDMITVTYAQGGVTLTLQARANEAAAIGESFEFTNIASGKVMQAVAAAPGRAVVGDQADALRAAILTDPSRLALR